jgi:hypothetical protein
MSRWFGYGAKVAYRCGTKVQDRTFGAHVTMCAGGLRFACGRVDPARARLVTVRAAQPLKSGTRPVWPATSLTPRIHYHCELLYA